jgi:alginate O-acetyltransferase complex protein AlgI
MLFNSFVFLFAFLPTAYTVFWMLRRAPHRHLWLAVSGYVFYGYWNPWFCLLMLFSTLVSYFAGLGLLRAQSDRGRQWFLVLPIAVDLSLLAFFKYAAFASETLQSAVAAVGLDWHVPDSFRLPLSAERLGFDDIILPVGISFYTVHTISYIVDAYRRTITPTRNFFEFAAYVSLFSQLVAGPIVRFRQLEEDLENLAVADRRRWLKIGVAYFVYGFAEKVLIADTLAWFVDPAFERWQQLSTVGAWVAAVGYTFQLYFDFSGYSSMAIGLGYLFGLRIPINFNSPYKATDPSDFWRRWHISLSTCLRDYIYIPLGGNRGGDWMVYRNLLLTMLIGGLWHGASWTFVIWGAYHGVLLSLYRACAPQWDRLPLFLRRSSTFLLVVIGWVVFRAPTLHVAGQLLAKMFLVVPGVTVASPVAFLAVTSIAGLWAMRWRNVHELAAAVSWDWHDTIRFAAIVGAALALMAGDRNSPFLYFQF